MPAKEINRNLVEAVAMLVNNSNVTDDDDNVIVVTERDAWESLTTAFEEAVEELNIKGEGK